MTKQNILIASAVIGGAIACLVAFGRLKGGPPAETSALAGQKTVLRVEMGDADVGKVAAGAQEEIACNRHEIAIPAPMKAALEKWDRSFVVWRSADYNEQLCTRVSTTPVLSLNAGMGDFNGDGASDAVMAGHNGRYELLVVVMSQNGAAYKVTPLASSETRADSAQGAYGCRILGVGFADGLKPYPRAAIYRILPLGTKFDVIAGSEGSYADVLGTDAFVAGLSQDFSGTQQKHEKPFMGLQLFRWNPRNKTQPEWKWLNDSSDFHAWTINSIDGNEWEFVGAALGD